MTESAPAGAAAAARLAKGKYVSLTTYRRDGRAVATPVWVVGDGARLLVWTAADSGKAKRLGHTARVSVAPCDARGKPRGPAFEGTARLVPEQAAAVRRQIRAKYPVGSRALSLATAVTRLVRRRPPAPSVGIEITFDSAAGRPGAQPS